MATVAERIELLHKNLAHVEAMGGEKKVEKQHAKGKLTARERLALLFDEGTFVEVNALVKSRCHNFGQEKKDLPGEGVVTVTVPLTADSYSHSHRTSPLKAAPLAKCTLLRSFT